MVLRHSGGGPPLMWAVRRHFVLVALFDLDGTLHNRAEGLRRFISDQAGDLCADSSTQEAFCAEFQRLDDNGKVWKDRVYDQLRAGFASASWPTTELLVQAYLREFPRRAVEAPGASNLLKLLRRHGVRSAIVTNGRSDLQRAVIESLGFDTLVNAVVISEEVGFRKPQPQIFRVALDALGCRPNEAIMVGDDLVADIEGALSAGIQPIAFRCKASDSIPLATDLESVGVEILNRLGRAA